MSKFGLSVASLLKDGCVKQDSDPLLLLKQAAASSGMTRPQMKKMGLDISQKSYKHVLKISKKDRVPTRNLGGRPEGLKIGHEKVKAVMMPHTSPSCRFLKGGVQHHLLKGSIRRNYTRCASLHKLGSYRSICRRMRKAKCQISVGKRRTDVCEICKIWDDQTSIIVTNCLKECVYAITALMPAYFKDWWARVEADEIWSATDFQRCDSPEYQEAFAEFIGKHEGRNLYLRMSMGKRGHAELRACEKRALGELIQNLPAVKECNLHFTLRDIFDEVLMRIQSQPSEQRRGLLRVLFDYQETVFF